MKLGYKIRTFAKFGSAIAALSILTACGSVENNAVRTGPQAVHPSNSKLARSGSSAADNMTVAMAAPAAAPTSAAVTSDPVAALDALCVQQAPGFSGAIAAFKAAGYTKSNEQLVGPDGSFSQVYERPGNEFAVALQYYPGAPQAFGCGVIAPNSAALRARFVQQTQSRPNAQDVTQIASQPGGNLFRAFAVPTRNTNLLFLSALSYSTRYGDGTTLALAVAPTF